MTSAAPELDARLADALGADPALVPLLTGGCGSGRTAVLLRLRDRLGEARCQYVDVERIATTPERFHRCLVSNTRFLLDGAPVRATTFPGTREAFDATLRFLQSAHTDDGGRASFLLDEVLELRTFESFPGLRTAMPDLLAAIADSPNRFVLTTRFTRRARRLAQGDPTRLQVHAIPTMPLEEVARDLAAVFADAPGGPPDGDMARAVHALADGHRGYVQALAAQMRAMSQDGVADPLSALCALLSVNGRLNAACRFSYELRLHRARGYGALKAILEVLGEEEPLTLTAIAHRLNRTPGSTKDYLSWLEDVDLVQVSAKRYRFADPMLRTWVRLYNRVEPPSDEVLGREVHRHAIERMAVAPVVRDPTTMAPPASAGAPRGRGRSDMIEFD